MMASLRPGKTGALAQHERNMNPSMDNKSSAPAQVPHGRTSGRGILYAGLFFFVLGAALSAVYFLNGTKTLAPSATPQVYALSDSTKAVLAQLDSPIQIRFYSLLDPATVSEPLKAFSSRVGILLAEYQQDGGGKVEIKTIDSQPDANAVAAVADGISPFNQDKGDACFLGIAILSKDRKEVLARLSPDWEPALEFDLARAIQRLLLPVAGPKGTQPAQAAAVISADVARQVRDLIPNIAAVQVDEGVRILQASALAEYQTVAIESNTKVDEAKQQLEDAKNGKSEAEQEAAKKHLLEVQSEQVEKLKAIAAKSMATVAAFKQLKADAH
jgi:hypothetical protein